MCAVAGVVNYQTLNEPNLASHLLRSLKHRGPDEQNSLVCGNLLLAHTRLSIQDIALGSQPFIVDDYILIFNGQIYNHLDLRKQYLSHISFRTQSDTETLLYLYIALGEKMFALLDGMFAFVIFNKTNNTLFMAVDKSGKKPFYYYLDKQIFFFASELNAIKENKSLNINRTHIEAFLSLGYFFQNTTPYENVHRLPAGHYATLHLRTLVYEQKSYFDFLGLYEHNADHLADSLEESKELVLSSLKQSVHNRLISSDIEVGAFLSGGIDSSLCVALASMSHKKPIKTFSVSFEGSSFDESSLAQLVADKYQTEHTKLSVNMDNLPSDIDTILTAYGEPFFDSSAIPTYYVSREAKKYVSVVLSGDGADELFGGYRRYVAIQHQAVFRLFSFLRYLIPRSHNKQSILNYLHRAFSMASKKSLAYYSSATSDIFDDCYSFDNAILNQFSAQIDRVRKSKIDTLSQYLYLDFANILYSDLLKKIDIASMQHALEVRCPFLSPQMLEIATKIPSKYKIKGINTKYILRQIAHDYLPQELLGQPKRGFEVPLKKWVENDLKEIILDRMPSGYANEFIDKKFQQQLIENKLPISREKRAKMLYSIFCLNTWHLTQS